MDGTEAFMTKKKKKVKKVKKMQKKMLWGLEVSVNEAKLIGKITRY